MPSPGRRSLIVLAFGLAALGSAWNPAAAPFGLVVGLVTAVLAWRSWRAGGLRWAAGAGLAAALGAVALSLTVLALTAGVGRGPSDTSLVPRPPAGETGRTLDAAAAETREARERAQRELEALPPGPKAPPAN